MSVINDLNPRADDLIVVPEDMEVSDSVPCHVYKMKFLHQPSIIRSGGYSMGLLDKFTTSSLGQLLGLKPGEKRESLRDIVFDKEKNGPKLRDSELLVKTNDERLLEDESGIVHDIGTESCGDLLVINPDLYKPVDVPVRSVQEMKEIYDSVAIRPADVQNTDLPRFWRYVRPTQDIVRFGATQKVVAPRGGVGFYIELDAANKTFAFSYALCHNNDNFDYGRARLITKGRFDDDNWFEVKNYNEKLGVVENISIALTNFLYNTTADETTDIVFSSTPDGKKLSYIELKELLQRI